MVTVDMAGTLEATAITGLAMAISGMAILAMVFLAIIITTTISSLTTAAGNGAPTARSTSAPAIIDSKRRKESRPGRGSGEFLDSLMIAVIVCPSPATNLVAGSSACRTAEMNLLFASRLSLLRQMHSRRLGRSAAVPV
jgi:hypothetical protein